MHPIIESITQAQYDLTMALRLLASDEPKLLLEKLRYARGSVQNAILSAEQIVLVSQYLNDNLTQAKQEDTNV